MNLTINRYMLCRQRARVNSKPLHERTGYLNFLLLSSDDTLKGLGALVGKRLINFIPVE